jgi:DNA excision repair protein ERCC-4
MHNDAGDVFAVVVEASLNDILRGRYKSDMKAHAAMQSLMAFTVRYGTSFVWSGSRAGGSTSSIPCWPNTCMR